MIVPFFGPRGLLRASLASALDQTAAVAEIWVVDDGSPQPLTRADVGDDERLQLIRQENRGPSAARNAAMRRARGEWIAFLDADDLWHPRKLELQLRVAAQCPEAALIATRVRQWWNTDKAMLAAWLSRDPGPAEGRPVGVLELVSGNPIPNSSVLIRRSVMAEVGWQDEEIFSGEDWDYWLRIASRHRLCQLSAELVLWYRHPEALLLRTDTAVKEMQTHRVLARHEAWLRPRLGDRVWRRALTEWDEFFGLRYLYREGDRGAARARLLRALLRRPLRGKLYRALLATLLPRRRPGGGPSSGPVAAVGSGAGPGA